MRRLIKYEWKRYLLAILLTGIFMIGYEIRDVNGWGQAGYMERVIRSYNGEQQIDSMDGIYELYELYEPVISIVTSISYSFTSIRNIIIITVMLLIMKFFQYWNERDSYGREFLVTLPVKGRTKKGFYVLANSILVMISMMLYMLGIWIYLISLFHRNAIEIPWLAKALLGEMITSISYMLMLLGIVEFLEMLFVDGVLKIIGTASMFGMSAYMLMGGFDIFGKIKWIQRLYGFLTLEGAGNQYVEVYDERCLIWTHIDTSPEILFQGRSLREVIMEENPFPWMRDYINGCTYPEFSRMFDFCQISTYVGWVICYLVIGCVIAGIAIWLAGKQDVSKNGFYFSFGRYLFSVLAGGFFFTICMISAVVWWHKCLIVIASICLTGILVYKTEPKKTEW